MKLTFPLILHDRDWQSLKPEPITALGRRKDLSKEEREYLEIFQTMDLRVQWACRQVVVSRRVLALLTLLTVILVAAHLRVLSGFVPSFFEHWWIGST